MARKVRGKSGKIWTPETVAAEFSWANLLKDLSDSYFTPKELFSLQPGTRHVRTGKRTRHVLGATSRVIYLNHTRPGVASRHYYFLKNIVRELRGALESSLATIRVRDRRNVFWLLMITFWLEIDDDTEVFSDWNVGTLYSVKTGKIAPMTNEFERTGKLPRGSAFGLGRGMIPLSIGSEPQYVSGSYYLDLGVNGIVEMLQARMPPRPPLLWIEQMTLEERGVLQHRDARFISHSSHRDLS